jgi:hypothetical protein
MKPSVRNAPLVGRGPVVGLKGLCHELGRAEGIVVGRGLVKKAEQGRCCDFGVLRHYCITDKVSTEIAGSGMPR